ncbi:MAG: tight adherence protein [Chloroflexota bacterium]|jgi:tight adherence protein B|nr:tight adherence protein [Chloroflexota bacterium]
MDPLMLLAALLAAVAVLLIFFGLFSGRRGDVEERLERYAAAGSATAKPAQAKSERKGVARMIAGSAAFGTFNRVVERRNWSADMARELARADLVLKPSEFLAIRAGAIIGIPAILFLLGATVVPTLNNPIALVVGAVVGFWLPRFWLGRRKGKRLKNFNKGLADTITLIANALRSGSSFLQAIELVVRETQPPISTEFGRVIREVNLGLPFEQALANMVRRVRSEDLELMTTAISIQHTVGGNLAEILDSIAFTIRERVRIKGEIKSLTAQARMSGYVVGFLPIGLVGILMVIAPKFMDPMFQKPPEMMGLPMGVIILSIGGVMMAIGFFIIRRIVDIEV